MVSTPKEVPVAARIVSMIITMVAVGMLASFFTRRIIQVKAWKSLPILNWLILAIYIASFIFISSTGLLSRAFDLNASTRVCDAATLLCVLSYGFTKILVYYFLVEKCYLIRSVGLSRFQSKLWLLNFFGFICPYLALVILVCVYRITYINKDGICVIGMHRQALGPTIVFDLFLNIWLTSLFLKPLRECYSYREKTNKILRNIVVRTFLGSCITLALSITNLTVTAILDGEYAYICLVLCNIDVSCTTLILHWVSSMDKSSPERSSASNSKRIQNINITSSGANVESFEEFVERVGDIGLDSEMTTEDSFKKVVDEGVDSKTITTPMKVTAKMEVAQCFQHSDGKRDGPEVELSSGV